MNKYLTYALILLTSVALTISISTQKEYKNQIMLLDNKNISYREYLLMHINSTSHFSLDRNLIVKSSKGNIRLQDFLSHNKDFLFLRVNEFGCKACVESFLQIAHIKKLDNRVCLLIQSTKIRDIKVLSSSYGNEYMIIGCENFIKKIDGVGHSYAFTIDENLHANNIFFPEYDKSQFINDYLEFLK